MDLINQFVPNSCDFIVTVLKPFAGLQEGDEHSMTVSKMSDGKCCCYATAHIGGFSRYTVFQDQQELLEHIEGVGSERSKWAGRKLEDYLDAVPTFAQVRQEKRRKKAAAV